MFVKLAINDEVVVIKHKLEQFHGVVNRHIGSFRDGRIGFKSVLSYLECQCCRYTCEEGYDNEENHDFLQVDGGAREFSNKVVAVRNSMLTVL